MRYDIVFLFYILNVFTSHLIIKMAQGLYKRWKHFEISKRWTFIKLGTAQIHQKVIKRDYEFKSFSLYFLARKPFKVAPKALLLNNHPRKWVSRAYVLNILTWYAKEISFVIFIFIKRVCEVLVNHISLFKKNFLLTYTVAMMM